MAGLRYDDYKGANLSDSAIAGMGDDDAARLCDSDKGQRVCYSKASALRANNSPNKNLFGFGDSSFVVDELYVKFLYGTAFKAPSSLFLYHEGILGSVPVNPNPGLLPQDIRSVEVLLGGGFDGHVHLSATLFGTRWRIKPSSQGRVGIIGPMLRRLTLQESR